MSPEPARAVDRVGLWELPLYDVAALRGSGTARCFTAGSPIAWQGSLAAVSFVVESGHVKATSVSTDGRSVLLAILRRGDVFGVDVGFPLERAGEADWRYVANVEAMSDCKLLAVHEGRLALWADGGTVRMKALLAAVADRSADLAARLGRMVIGEAPGRLAAEMAALCRTHGTTTTDGVRIGVPLSQSDLAAMAGCARETANRVVGDLAGMGALRRVGQIYTALDIGLLDAIAAGRRPQSQRRRSGEG